MTKRMRWKKEPPVTGLASVGAAPRGYIYHDGETEFSRVHALGGGWRGPVKGWYWVAFSNKGNGIEYCNTCKKPCETPEEAKRAATAYVKSQLLQNGNEGQSND